MELTTVEANRAKTLIEEIEDGLSTGRTSNNTMLAMARELHRLLRAQ